jgi:hypothetical protein
MKTLALYFEQDTTVEITFDDTIIKMYQAQKAVEERILNADDPEEESAKIEAEAEAMLAEAEALKNSLNNIARIMADRCENRMTLDDLEKLANTTFTEEIISADEVPDDIRALADADEEEKNSH